MTHIITQFKYLIQPHKCMFLFFCRIANEYISGTHIYTYELNIFVKKNLSLYSKVPLIQF